MRLHDDPSPIRACAELYLTDAQLQNEARYFAPGKGEADIPNTQVFQKRSEMTGFWARFRQLFIHPRMRRYAVDSIWEFVRI